MQNHCYLEKFYFNMNIKTCFHISDTADYFSTQFKKRGWTSTGNDLFEQTVLIEIAICLKFTD